jgi:dihydrofolate reductase
MPAHLIQKLIVTHVRALIGAAISLFGPIQQNLRWRHEETVALPSGLVQLCYRIA